MKTLNFLNNLKFARNDNNYKFSLPIQQNEKKNVMIYLLYFKIAVKFLLFIYTSNYVVKENLT